MSGISSPISAYAEELECKELDGFASSSASASASANADNTHVQLKNANANANADANANANADADAAQLNLYETLPESSSYPIMPLLLTSVLLGAIFMALFSSYSPINLKKLKIY